MRREQSLLLMYEGRIETSLLSTFLFLPPPACIIEAFQISTYARQRIPSISSSCHNHIYPCFRSRFEGTAFLCCNFSCSDSINPWVRTTLCVKEYIIDPSLNAAQESLGHRRTRAVLKFLHKASAQCGGPRARRSMVPYLAVNIP